MYQIIGFSKGKERSQRDFYPTPPEVTEALVHFLGLKNLTIWEPACGENDMAQVLRDAGNEVIATDIQSGVDFLTCQPMECDWIITNPPFKLADQFITRCAEIRKPFALLLKSQYWHAGKRYELFRKHIPSFVLPLTWRPDFLFKNAREYGQPRRSAAPLMDVIWCAWNPPYVGPALYHPLQKPR